MKMILKNIIIKFFSKKKEKNKIDQSPKIKSNKPKLNKRQEQLFNRYNKGLILQVDCGTDNKEYFNLRKK